jgi:hypothetical protein
MNDTIDMRRDGSGPCGDAALTPGRWGACASSD